MFLGFEWVLLGTQFIVSSSISDSSVVVDVQKARTEFINKKVIDKVADENVERAPEVEDNRYDDDVPTNTTGCCLCTSDLQQGNALSKYKNGATIEPFHVFEYPTSSNEEAWFENLTKHNFSSPPRLRGQHATEEVVSQHEEESQAQSDVFSYFLSIFYAK